MTTLALNTGMASKYFITDLKRATTVLESPHVLLGNNVGMAELSEALATIHNSAASSVLGLRLFKPSSKKIDVSSFQIFLQDLIDQKKPPLSDLCFNSPIFIVANGIANDALAAIKILKIRGFGSFLVLDTSSHRDEASILRLENELQPEFFLSGVFGKLYKPSKHFTVVCGISKTVLSNEKNSREIFCEFPSLATKLNLEAEQEPLI